MKQKKIYIIITLLMLVTAVIYFMYPKKEYQNSNANLGNMAIMLEDSANSNTYFESANGEFPQTGYSYNAEKSYCLNGSNLTWDNTNKKISTTISGSEKCYVYFDKIPFGDIILTNNGGAAAIEAKGTPNFATVATTNEGMYAAQDDYGTSYYFRGAVDNNWVKFAGMYWRIVRINGDGTVKLIYSGTTAPTESQKVVMTGTGTQLAFTTYVFNSSYDNNMYVGYMYTSGNVHGTGTSSTIKTYLDNWYASNLASYASKLADSLFCNDRSPSTSDSTLNGSGGTGTTVTYYGPYIRNIANSTPILTCPNKSDAFTVSDTTKGNGALINPVGLITADEVAMAGGVYSTTNSSYYLYTNNNYWTGSPYYFNNGYAAEFSVGSGGNLSAYYVNNGFGVRAVVSLTSNIEITGSGTWNDPYLVQ